MTDTTEPHKDGEEPPKPTGKSTRPVLKIVLDTNQLYTGSASDLLNQELRKVIEGSRQHNDLKIEWFVPEVVRWEREYQMTEAAGALLPALAKLERLLGHGLALSEEILVERVRAAIEKHLLELALKPLVLKMTDVDWQKMTKDAVFRRPPFEKGKTEKGFRDAIIVESFMQLVASSPKTPALCRVAMVSADNLLITAVTERTAGLQNIRILKSVEDIQGLINTLVSTATEEFVGAIKKQAEKYFFSADDKAGIYFSENIHDRVVAKYSAQLRERPSGADSRENGNWRIGPPGFVQKHGQRITWSTTIRVEASAYRAEPVVTFGSTSGLLGSGRESGLISSVGGGGIRASVPITNYAIQPLNISYLNDPVRYTAPVFDLKAFDLPSTEKTLVAKGNTTFHVIWSLVVTSNKKLTLPKIERIDFAETVWQ